MSEVSDSIIRTMDTKAGGVRYYSLPELSRRGIGSIDSMPVSAKILLEAVVRHVDGSTVTEDHMNAVAAGRADPGRELAFKPARVIMQDFTGVPAIVDLAAMRDSLADLGGDPAGINPLVPVDLVIDHSVQVDRFGSQYALMFNAEKEFERNQERYEFLHWASRSFKNFSVVPPATGIVHQVNLEYLAKVVQVGDSGHGPVAYPDTLVGTDSHTTMINGLGVLGWGVGGIEAEAALLGQPIYIRMPEVVGVHLYGRLNEGVTATDLVLRVTEVLRELGVVGSFVEFYGDGLDAMSLPDRATVSNMCPEYGATAALFPVDDTTLSYLRTTGRPEDVVDLVERYTKEQGLFRSSAVGGSDMSTPHFSKLVELDLGTVKPSVAGPKRPQDRSALDESKQGFRVFMADFINRPPDAKNRANVTIDGETLTMEDGAVVIAAITSCTNTSNPSVMVAAGLVAKNAVEKGLSVPAYVKTSLAPGSRVVTRYLELSDVTQYLDELGFNLVGYGCTTCIGNSGPLREEVSAAVTDNDLVAVSVLSGNRNFEGRIHPEVRANYLASPPLVVAYALAGTFDIDLTSEPLGTGKDGRPVYLKDIWPSQEDVQHLVEEKVRPELYEEEYADVYSGNEQWNDVKTSESAMYDWQPTSTYIKRPPFFEGLTTTLPQMEEIRGARVLALLGDSVTTDHISPAGVIAADSPAGRWLTEHGVERADFNSYGSRRGNHEVMMRGTLANIRIRNKLVPGTEGGITRHIPSGDQLSIYGAAAKYAEDGIPLIVIAGKDYGMGSSRDWAAKGVALLGVRAVIAESFERIHRSNLIGMGVLPLEFAAGSSAESLGLTGTETFDISDVSTPRSGVSVTAHGDTDVTFETTARIDTDVEMEYYRNGGILHTVLRRMGREAE